MRKGGLITELPVSLMSGVFPPSADNAGDGGEADLAIFEVAEAVNAEAEEDDPVEEADASRLLCALHAVYDGGGGGGGGGAAALCSEAASCLGEGGTQRRKQR